MGEADNPAGVRMTGAMHLLLHTRLHDLRRANFTSKTPTFKNSYESSLRGYCELIKMCKVKVIHISQRGIVAAHTICLCVLCGSENKQRLFLTDCFFFNGERACLLRGTDWVMKCNSG